MSFEVAQEGVVVSGEVADVIFGIELVSHIIYLRAGAGILFSFVLA